MLARWSAMLGPTAAEPVLGDPSGALLPNTGVKISMLAFGGLSLLFLGAAAFVAGRRRRRSSR